MTDVPQWAVERAKELAAMWNDPGQEAAIARALAEAREEGRREQFNLVTRRVFEDALAHGVVVYKTTVRDDGQLKMTRIDPSELKPAPPEVEAATQPRVTDLDALVKDAYCLAYGRELPPFNDLGKFAKCLLDLAAAGGNAAPEVKS